jgi:hypothetical protein
MERTTSPAGAETVTVIVSESVPPWPSLTVKVTVKVPAAVGVQAKVRVAGVNVAPRRCARRWKDRAES